MLAVRRMAPELASLSLSLVLELALCGAIALLAASGHLPTGFANRLVQAEATSLVTIAPVSGSGPPSLSLADLDAVERADGDAAARTRVVFSNTPAVTLDAIPRATVEGVDPSFLLTSGATLARGAFFTDQDSAAASPTAVLGHGIALSLFADPQAAIGTTVRIRSLPFTIVGVLAAAPAPGLPTDTTVLVPFQTGQVRLFGSNAAYELVLQAGNASQARLLADRAQQVLQQRHHVGADQAPDFTVRTTSLAGSIPALQLAVRTLQLTEQYTCRAKAVCASTR